MGSSCCTPQVHGPSDELTPATVSANVGPVACLCVPTGKVPEGMHLLEVGAQSGTFVLRRSDKQPLRGISQGRITADPSSSSSSCHKTSEEKKKAILPLETVLEANPDVKPEKKDAHRVKDMLHKLEARLEEPLHWVKDHLSHPGSPRLDTFVQDVLSGRILQVARELELDSVTRKKFFRDRDKEDTDRIKRVSKAFSSSMDELKTIVDPRNWHDPLPGANAHQVSFRVSADKLHVISVSDHTGIDMLDAFVALCEVSLLFRHVEDSTMDVAELGNYHANESLWRVLKDKPKEDNLLRAQYVDALDEECGMLWVSIQGLHCPRDQFRYDGICVPQPLRGHKRVQMDDHVYALVRLNNKDTRLIAIHTTSLSLARRCYYRFNSQGWLSRLYFQRQMQSFIAGFRELTQQEYLKRCTQHGPPAQESPRVALYTQIKRHLAVKQLSSCID